MFHFCNVVFLFFMAWHCAAAMKCPFSDGNEYSAQFGLSSAVECPRIMDSSDEIFCCLNENGHYYCCDANEFEHNLGAGVVIAIAVGVILFSSVILCICCCCCPCCCLYKRRHRGTVYGNMPQPGVQTTVIHVPQPVVVPAHTPVYPAGMQQASAVPPTQLQQGFYPPTYDEATAKQAPYNPNY